MQDMIIDKKTAQLNNPEIFMVEGPPNRENGESIRMRVALFPARKHISTKAKVSESEPKVTNDAENDENPDLLQYKDTAPIANGTFLIIVGRAEYIEKYADVIWELNNRGFDALVVDNRGQGFSDRLLTNPQAGHMDSFDDAARHVAMAYQKLHDRLTAPLFLMGHSMGGLIGLQIITKNYIPRIKAAVFTAPLWGLNPIPFANIFAKIANFVGLTKKIAILQPKIWQPIAFEGNKYTNSTSYFRRNNALMLAEPKLQLAGATFGWLNQTYETLQGFTPENLAKIKIPVMIAQAEDEQIIDNKGMRAIAARLPLAQVNIIEGAKHEILMETDDKRKVFYDYFDTFIKDVYGK